MMLWTEKYRPKKLDEIIGQTSAVKEIRDWIEEVKEKKVKKALLLYGPPGTGKTSAAHAIASELDFDAIEVNASEVAAGEKLKSVISNLGAPSLFGRDRLIIIDEADALSSSEAREIARLAEKLVSICPIVITVNDMYKNVPPEIRRISKPVKFNRLRWTTIRSVLASIARSEGVNVTMEVLKEIAVNASGDLRAAINDLQAICQGSMDLISEIGERIGQRDVEKGIFDLLKAVLISGKCGYSKVVLRSLNQNPRFVFRWIEENLPLFYKDPKALRKAYDALSRADLFFKRASETGKMGLLTYSIDLMTFGVCSTKTEKPRGWVKFRFPDIIRRRSATKEVRKEAKEIAMMLAKKLHISSSQVIEEIFPIIREDIKREGKILGYISHEIGISKDRIKEIIS
ncbi:MAG TPA: replication factor C large subunit [Candidatus Korarchaeota archaeon]|nr:replication factor C large subunit [Candidatus Korarchaeota archaeon]